MLTARRREPVGRSRQGIGRQGVETAIVTGDAREEETARQSCAAAKDSGDDSTSSSATRVLVTTRISLIQAPRNTTR